MSDAPKRVWVEFRNQFVDIAHWGHGEGRTEYILATPAALSDHPTVKALVATERDAWREEPESSEAWCAGNQHVLDRLCVVVGADPAAVQWDGSDGSLQEETDALIWRILRHNDDDDGLSPRERALVAEAVAAERERCIKIAVWHWEGEPEDTIAMAAEMRVGMAPLSDYEKKVAQMKEGFPNGI